MPDEPFTATVAVERAQDGAGQFVNSKFREAQAYAANAWKEANDYLKALSTVVVHSGIDTKVSVPFNYTGSAIVIGAQGERPITPDLTYTLPANTAALGLLKELPSYSYLTDPIDTCRVMLLDRIQELLEEGCTGLPPEVEQAIFDRAKGRQDLENARMYTEAEQYFSSRGFDLPPGALAGRLQEINIEITRNNSNLNNDVMVAQANLAQQNMHFAVKEGAATVIAMMESSIRAVIDSNKGTIDVFVAEIEAYKTELTAVLSEIEAKTKIFMAEADVYKAISQVNMADITAQVEVAKIGLQEASIESELRLKEASIELDAVLRLHQLQVTAMEAGSKVTSQIVASALAAVNASANYGFSGSANLGASSTSSYSRTKEHKEIHTWDETKSRI